MTKKYFTIFTLLFILFSVQNTAADSCKDAMTSNTSYQNVVKTTKAILSQQNLSMKDYKQITRSAVIIAANTGSKDTGYKILHMLQEKDNLPEGVAALIMEAMEKIESLKPAWNSGKFFNPYEDRGITI